MKSSEFRHITDELLSAYLDNAVSEQERAYVEAAVIAEPDIAWRLDSLRQTVQILRSLPELTLPRSFTLQEAQLGETLVTRRATSRTPAQETTPATPGWWNGLVEGWRALWQAGNPVLRNAAAASFVLLLMLIGGTSLLATQPQAAQVASAPESVVTEAQPQPAQEEAIALASPVASATGTVEILAAADESSADESAPVEQPAAQSAAGEAEQFAPAAQEDAVQEDADASAGEAAMAQVAPGSAAAPQGAEPLLTPVAPLNEAFMPGARYAPGMGGDGGGAGSGGAPGMPGDVPVYPGDTGGGLLPPGAYDSGPDFVPAEPAGAVPPQGAAPKEPEEEAAGNSAGDGEEAPEIAMLPPDDPTATPVSEEVDDTSETESVTGESEVDMGPVATTTSYGVQITGSGLLRMAQVGLGLITLMLVSLWWRSRGDSTD